MTPEELEAAQKREILAANADAKQSAQQEKFDRSTVIAFSLLFILPAIIIVLCLLFFLPYVVHSVQQDPSGATTLRSNSQP